MTLKLENSVVEGDHPPFVPSHALIVVQFGIPSILYHQGTELDYWIEGTGVEQTAEDCMGVDHKDGIFVWSGSINSWTDYWGEYDEELTDGEVRPVTEEEWKAFVKDEIVWDFAEMGAQIAWEFNAEKRNQEDDDGIVPGCVVVALEGKPASNYIVPSGEALVREVDGTRIWLEGYDGPSHRGHLQFVRKTP